MNVGEQGEEAALGARQVVAMPRWVIYCQGALLGVVAATFFIFGLLVGSFTQTQEKRQVNSECQVRGRVVYTSGGDRLADGGAVVLLLPRDRAPAKRYEGQTLRPASFQALSNPVIESIHASGGAVVRADRQGRFEVYVDSPATYLVLVISRHQTRLAEAVLTKSEMAKISRFFAPVEGLVQNQQYFLEMREFDSKTDDLGTLVL